MNGPDRTFAGVSLFADNQNGSFDTEDNQPLLSAFPIGSTVVQNVVIPVQEAGPKANNDGGWTQINGLGLYGSADFGKNLIKKISIPLADLGIDAGATFYEMQIALNGDWTGSATISIDNIAIEGPPAAPTTVLANLAFDTAADVLPWSYDFGDASNMSTVSWSSAENNGNPGSGSLKLKFHYPNDGVAFTGDVFADPGIDLGNATIVSFDVKVDPASATDAFGKNVLCLERGTDGFSWVAEVFENTGGQPLYDTLVAASPDARIEFEVYYRGADFPLGSFANVSVALDDGTWSQVDNQAEYVAPAYGTDTVKTVSIPLSALGWSAGATYYKLVLGVNGDWGTSESANVYVDDIRLVTPASEMQVPLVVTSVSKGGDDLTVTFTGKPDNAANWIVKGSTDLLGFPDDMTSSSTITEPAAGSYQAVIDVTGKGSKYFVRIQD